MSANLENRFLGSLLGLSLADALGAVYEGGPIGTILWAVIGAGERGKRRWTDELTNFSVIRSLSPIVSSGSLLPAEPHRDPRR